MARTAPTIPGTPGHTGTNTGTGTGPHPGTSHHTTGECLERTAEFGEFAPFAGADTDVGAGVGIDVDVDVDTDTHTGTRIGPHTAALGRGFPGGAPRVPVRRGTADPVKLLLHRYRTLCENAVDPLEIAAVLEAHGITDKAALSRFRHRDVFTLAEELYARVPHDTARADEADAEGTQGTPGAPRPKPLAPWMLVTPAPGVVAALTLFLLDRTGGQTRLGVALTGAAALSCAVAASLRYGPLRAEGRRAPAVRLWVYWLLAYAVYGDGLLSARVEGGSGSSWSATPTSLVALSFALVPAAWCAHLFSLRARRRLFRSRDLADFAAGTRPPLLVGVALYACALTGIALLVPLLFRDGGDPAHVAALGTLLLLARLLTVHGFPGAAAAGLAAACAVEALACLSVLVAGLPGCAVLGTPVAQAVHAWGAGAVPALACGAAATGLVCHAAVSLARASAHT